MKSIPNGFLILDKSKSNFVVFSIDFVVILIFYLVMIILWRLVILFNAFFDVPILTILNSIA